MLEKVPILRLYGVSTQSQVAITPFSVGFHEKEKIVIVTLSVAKGLVLKF